MRIDGLTNFLELLPFKQSKPVQPQNDIKTLFDDYMVKKVPGYLKNSGSGGELNGNFLTKLTTLPPSRETSFMKIRRFPLVNTHFNGSIDWQGLKDAIMGLGAQFQDLIDQISASTDLEERRNLGRQFQEAVVSELNQMGFTASATEYPDKIMVNGVMIDILRSLNSPGTETAVQVLVIEGNWDPSSNPSGNNHETGVIADLVKSAGIPYQSLIDQISLSTLVEERQSLAFQLQSQIVDQLNQMGVTAETTDSPDKIMVNGQRYDFIRSLGAPGVPVELQALMV